MPVTIGLNYSTQSTSFLPKVRHCPDLGSGLSHKEISVFSVPQW